MRAELAEYLHMNEPRVATGYSNLAGFLTSILFFGLFLFGEPMPGGGRFDHIYLGLYVLIGTFFYLVTALHHLFDEIQIRRGKAVAGGFGFLTTRVLFVLLAFPSLPCAAVFAIGMFQILTQ